MSDSGSDRDVSELAREVIDELEPGSVIDDRVILSRRQAVGLATGAISLGALGGFGARSAQAGGAAGAVGTAEEPVDMFAWDLDVANELTSDLAMGGNDVRDVGSLSTEGARIASIETQDARTSLSEAISDAGDGGTVWVTADETIDGDDRISPQNGQTIIGKGGVITVQNHRLEFEAADDVTFFNMHFLADESSDSFATFDFPYGGNATNVDFIACLFDASSVAGDPVFRVGNVNDAYDVRINSCRMIGAARGIRFTEGTADSLAVGNIVDDSVDVSSSATNIQTAGNVIK